jgi:hypothetical protein
MSAPLPLTVLNDGVHIVDPSGWTVAKCYGDYAEEYARLIIAAVNSRAELLDAVKAVDTCIENDILLKNGAVMRQLKTAIAHAEESAP